MIILEYGPKDFCYHVQVQMQGENDREPNTSSCCKAKPNLYESNSESRYKSEIERQKIMNYSYTNIGSGNSSGTDVFVKGKVIKSETKIETEITNNEICNSDKLTPNALFSFDEILQSLWNDARSKGLFRYTFENANVPMKVIAGKYRFIAQLNPDRALKRRAPQEIHDLNQAFNINDFHFDKVKIDEKILTLNSSWGKFKNNKKNDNIILINVSPLEYGHILLVPSISQHQPQRITFEGLKLAVELLLLSKSCNFRVGFNSLCGYASVNHHHYHAYYLNHRLFLEFAELKSLGGPCKEIIDYPAPGFAFTIVTSESADIDNFVKDAFRLTSYLQENNVAHNVSIMRGSSIGLEGHFDSIRLFVWARSPSYGAKINDAFNPALCELGGHFPMKNHQSYETLTEDLICQMLSEICEETFARLRPFVSTLWMNLLYTQTD